MPQALLHRPFLHILYDDFTFVLFTNNEPFQKMIRNEFIHTNSTELRMALTECRCVLSSVEDADACHVHSFFLQTPGAFALHCVSALP